MRDKAVDNRAECALPASAFSGNDNKFSFLYSCGGFYTPALCAVIKGIKTDCNHLIEHTVRNVEHCTLMLCIGLVDYYKNKVQNAFGRYRSRTNAGCIFYRRRVPFPFLFGTGIGKVAGNGNEPRRDTWICEIFYRNLRRHRHSISYRFRYCRRLYRKAHLKTAF